MENESKVLLTVLSRQSFPGVREEKTEYAVPGRLARAGNAFFLAWTEPGEGMEGVASLLRLEGEIATLSRRGPFRARMTFQEGLRHFFRYVTPYGTVEMAILTHRLEQDLTGDEGQIRIVYQLETGPGEAGLMELQIHIRESDTI